MVNEKTHPHASTSAQRKPSESPRSSEFLVRYCFEVLEATLRRQPLPVLPEGYHHVAPIFITWYKPAPKYPNGRVSEELRGCIGCLSAVTWETGLADYALKAALHDSRFEPIRLEELPELDCKVSVLHSFEDCRDPYEWTIGKHGITVNFTIGNQRGKYSATYLPEIAVEHNMSHEAAIVALVRKAGYRYSVANALQTMTVTRYQSHKVSLGYAMSKGIKY
eukprot:GEMP01029274.1.p1 GENE.GEMP01029274.1~~GEMP01029274.1.p1  ORF type:complete len:221 (-),score=38.88 GEMP01029274.1:1430-2092(-)